MQSKIAKTAAVTLALLALAACDYNMSEETTEDPSDDGMMYEDDAMMNDDTVMEEDAMMEEDTMEQEETTMEEDTAADEEGTMIELDASSETSLE